MNLKKKNIIPMAALLILNILLIVFIIPIFFSGIKEVSQSIPSEKQELAELEKKTENLNKFKKILPEISLNLEKIDALFISRELPIDFKVFLEKIAQDSKIGLNISLGSSSQEISTADPWAYVIFHLSLAGPFSNFSNFLEKLESSPYLIEIQDLNITSETKPFEFEQFYLGNVKANISIKVYAK